MDLSAGDAPGSGSSGSRPGRPGKGGPGISGAKRWHRSFRYTRRKQIGPLLGYSPAYAITLAGWPAG